jgi:OOP family OmpA-OmpF porin
MRKIVAAVALAALPVIAIPTVASAQAPTPGIYVGLEGGLNWMMNTNILGLGIHPQMGFQGGAVVGYDFVGPRVELEVVYRQNQHGAYYGGRALDNSQNGIGQIAVMANLLYDFNFGSAIIPYVGAGVGAAFVDSDQAFGSTQFAYQGIIGVGYKFTVAWRINLDGRYHATTNPSVAGTSWKNENLSVMLGLTYKFGAPEAAAPMAPPPAAVPAPPSFMVFFDWDRSDLSQQAQGVIAQAANSYKQKGNARVTATGHADRSGPDAYNMALSLRRANAVKDALVRNGVPANVIVVTGRGESMPLVQTADGVREPQNRRVEIVVQ